MNTYSCLNLDCISAKFTNLTTKLNTVTYRLAMNTYQQSKWLREHESDMRQSGYEPAILPLNYPAVISMGFAPILSYALRISTFGRVLKIAIIYPESSVSYVSKS